MHTAESTQAKIETAGLSTIQKAQRLADKNSSDK